MFFDVAKKNLVVILRDRSGREIGRTTDGDDDVVIETRDVEEFLLFLGHILKKRGMGKFIDE